MGEGAPPLALFAALPGQVAPEALRAAFLGCGFVCEDRSLDALAAGGGRGDALGVLWTGGDWDGGFAALDALPAETIRRNTVLVGPSPPDGLGPRIRRAGGLTFVRDPVPPWLPPLLAETVVRAGREHPLAILGALRSLSEGVNDSPLAVLRAIAGVGRRLLHADQALAAIRRPGEAFEVLVETESGVVASPWAAGLWALEPPPGLCAAAVEHDEIIVTPDLRYSRLSRPPSDVQCYQAAVSVPVAVRPEGIAPPEPPLVATLNFYWERPFLPTAGEMRILDVLAALAGATLLRQVERERLSTTHVAGNAALAGLPRVFPPSDESADGPASLDEALRIFARHTLEAHAGSPQLLELWARATESSRRDPVWVSLGASPDALRPDVLEGALEGAHADEPVAVGGGRWALVASVGGRRMGDVVAIFASRAGAAMAWGDVRSLAADVELGVRMLRRAADSGAVVRLSRVLAGAGEPANALRDMAELVRDRMSADGCRVVVVRESSDGPRLVQLRRTDSAEAEVDLGPVREDRGLEDWVLHHDDWLCAVDPAPPGRADPEVCATGRHGRVSVVSRLRPSARAGGHSSRLFVPLRSRDRVAGVLEVWRDSDHPFDLELDSASLVHFAPHVASACRRVLQLVSQQDELGAISSLMRQLGLATRLRAAYEAVLAKAGELAAASHAVLLHHDLKQPGHLYFGAAWAVGEAERERLESALRGFHLDAWTEPDDWHRTVSEAAGRLLRREGAAPLRFRSLLFLPRGPGDWPLAVVALLDPPVVEKPYAAFAQDLMEHAALSFLHYAGAMLTNHVRANATWIVEQLGGPGESASMGADQVLERAAKLLHEAVDADGALVYSGDAAEMIVVNSYPPVEALKGMPVVRGSLTWQSVTEGKALRVLDVADPRDLNQRKMDREALDRIADAFGWRAVRSWLCVPVVHNGRSIGAIKVLMSDGGSFLGSHHEEIASAVANRAAWEIHKGTRRMMLEELNREANELAGLEGPELNLRMVGALERWMGRFVRAGCQIGIFARVPPDRVLVEIASGGVSDASRKRLATLSRDCGTNPVAFRSGAAVSVGKVLKSEPFDLHGIGHPLRLPGEGQLEGHLFALHTHPLSNDARAVVQEAAREASVLLNGERLRQEWILRSGLFRHAFLGPAQGLTSAARLLGRLAGDAGAPAETVTALTVRVEEEAEHIRLWRENQRLYMGGPIEIRPRNLPLRPVVDRCVDRYRGLMVSRGVRLEYDWQEKGPLIFPFDADAVDLALSNILDNARKYVFFNRAVVVGARVEGRYVKIWVEDVGHPIPERMREDIYQLGSRIDWKDPLRPIQGQGLGLPMARAVVEAHGGQLYHECELEGSGGGSGDDRFQPYLVRFVMKLPHHWRRRG